MEVVRRLAPLGGPLIVIAGLTACANAPVTGTGTAGPSSTAVSTTTSVVTPTTTSPAPATTGDLGPVILEPGAGHGSDLRLHAGRHVHPHHDHVRAGRPHGRADPGGRRRPRRPRPGPHGLGPREQCRNQPAQAYLAAHGVAVAFAPASRITHQKTICTDDDACLIMSLNMVADDYPSTRDVAVEDSDPGDVSAIESTFAADFSGDTAPATSNGDHLLWSPGSEPGIVGRDQRSPPQPGSGERGDGLDGGDRCPGRGGPARGGSSTCA